MRTSKVLLALVLTLSLVLAACPSGTDSNQRQQVAQAAADASTVLRGFQQGEIVAYEAGKIPAPDHLFIQQSLIAVAQMGKTTDSCIRSTTSNQGIVACVNVSVATIDQLNSEGSLRLKSDEAKNSFTLAMIGTRTALAVITAVLGEKQ